MNIEIFSDLICPWCFIGKRRLEQALAKFDSSDCHIIWQPFELNPNMPVEGIKREDYRLKKFGSLEYSQKLDAQVVEAGLKCGIEFNFGSKTPNTFNAHRLAWYCYSLKKNQNDLMESLFQAYFCDGNDIGDISILAEIGSNHGFEKSELLSFLKSDQGRDEIKEELKRAQDLNLNGVPAFIIDGEPAFTGAQDPDFIADFLRRKNA